MKCLSLTEIFGLFGLIGTWLIVVTTLIITVIKLIERSEVKPKITTYKYLGKGRFEITVVNCKSPRTAMYDILCAKKSRLSLFSKSIPAIWNYPIHQPSPQPAFNQMDKLAEMMKSRMQTKNITYIEDQANLVFEIPNFDPTATYKVIVKTSDGSCKQFVSSTQGLTES